MFMDFSSGKTKKLLELPFWVGHLQANPYKSNAFMYCWGTRGDAAQKLWHVTVEKDGKVNNKALYKERPNDWVTHEVFVGPNKVMNNELQTNMKSISRCIALCFAFTLFACNRINEKTLYLILKNPSDIELTNKPIRIEKKEIKIDWKENQWPLLVTGPDTLAYQLNDLDEDGEWDELFVMGDFAPKEKKKVSVLTVSEQPVFDIRTSIRFGKRDSAREPVTPRNEDSFVANEVPEALGYQPYQTDGPTWENDKVGFRHYFDGRNSKDIFGKKMAKISPETVGLNENGAVQDNYHVMEHWGRDILAVGNSVGIGGYGLLVNDSLLRLGITIDDTLNNIEKTHFKILEEGPVYSALKYQFQSWEVMDRNYSVDEKTSIWPGMYAYKNEVTFKRLQGDEVMAIGIPTLNTDKPLQKFNANDEFVILYTHDMQSYDKTWWLGMALILPKNEFIGTTEAPKEGNFSNSYIAKMSVTNETPISYYAVSGWELADAKFKEEEKFKDYIKQLADQLSVEVNYTITEE